MGHASEYLSTLPDGLASYPGTECKASLLNTFAQPHRVLLSDSLVDETLRNLVIDPPPPSTWIPEVHVQFIFQMIRELRFPKDEDFIEHSRRMNKQLLSSPLYHVLFRTMSHSRVARMAGSAWRRFHRGTSLTVVSAERDSHVARMDFPSHLLTPVSVAGITTGIEYALYLGGARGLRTETLEMSPEHYLFRIVWGTAASEEP